MSSKLLVALILVVIIASTQGADCKYGDLIIKEGENGYPENECVNVRCIDGTNLSKLPCPQIGIPHGCEVIYEGIDLSKQYPDCCAKAYCDPKQRLIKPQRSV